MIRAIVFDCFGVLTSEGWLPFKKKYFGQNEELEGQATDLSKQLNAGYIDNDEFVSAIAKLAQVSKIEALRAVQRNVPDEDLLDYIRQNLKGKYKLGILSNAGGNRLHELFTAEQLDLFDNAALSFETGYVKPYEQAYHDIASKLGVSPEECVFVDDQERHCTGAQQVGMPTVLYHDFDQFKHDIEKLLGDMKN